MGTMMWVCVGVLCGVFVLGGFCMWCALKLSSRASRAEEQRRW